MFIANVLDLNFMIVLPKIWKIHDFERKTRFYFRFVFSMVPKMIARGRTYPALLRPDPSTLHKYTAVLR